MRHLAAVFWAALILAGAWYWFNRVSPDSTRQPPVQPPAASAPSPPHELKASPPAPAGYLVGIVMVQRNTFTGRIATFFYPLARVQDGQLSGIADMRQEEAMLSQFQGALRVYEGGHAVGTYRIRTTDRMAPGCGDALAVHGDLTLDPGTPLFDAERRLVWTETGKGPNGEPVHRSWTQFVAMESNASEGHDFLRQVDPMIVESLSQDAVRLAGAYPDAPTGTQVEEFRIFDLDGDGYAETAARLQAGSRSQWVWIRYQQEQDPQLIYTRQSDANRRIELADVADVTGDGIAEVVLKVSDRTSAWFEVLALRPDGLKPVFSGARSCEP